MSGLNTTKEEPKVKKTDNKKQDNKAANTSRADEAKAILAKMEAKKDAGDCPFC